MNNVKNKNSLRRAQFALFFISKTFFSTSMSSYSPYKLGKIDLETEKAFLAFVANFTDQPIWIPKSVVHPETKLIKQWFIDLKDKELKDFMRPKKQSDLDQFFQSHIFK